MKIIIGIFTGPTIQDRKAAILKTWVRDIPDNINYYFVYGNCKDKITLKTDNDLFLDCPESYESICLKTYNFYSYCYDNLDFDYILRVDDDTYVDINKLLQQDITADYTGHIVSAGLKNYTYHYGKCTDKRYEKPFKDDSNSKFCCGGGYMISKKAVGIVVNSITRDKIIEKFNKNKNANVLDVYGAGTEDRMVGRLLHGADIKRSNTGRWLNKEKLLYSAFNDSIFHPVYPDIMNQITTPEISKYVILDIDNKYLK